MGQPFGSPFQDDRPNPASVQLGSQPHAHRAAADHDHIVRTQSCSSTLNASAADEETCLVVLIIVQEICHPFALGDPPR
jgi:hypothetical protein